MGFKEKMMEDMINKMSSEEKFKMMNSMMDQFMSSITSEEKQKMMSDMMPKMMENMMKGGFSHMGGGMMKMMSKMMGSKGKNDNDMGTPWDMCKKMMSTMNENFEIAKFATPELRALFDEWIQQIMDEILKYIEESKSIDSEKIAEHFKISTDSVNFILSKLAKDGKIILNANKK